MYNVHHHHVIYLSASSHSSYIAVRLHCLEHRFFFSSSLLLHYVVHCWLSLRVQFFFVCLIELSPCPCVCDTSHWIINCKARKSSKIHFDLRRIAPSPNVIKLDSKRKIKIPKYMDNSVICKTGWLYRRRKLWKLKKNNQTNWTEFNLIELYSIPSIW